MARLAIISVGTLGTALLEACARRGVFDEIVLATRDVERANRAANNALVGAALEGRYPSITAVPFDMHATDAAFRLRDLGADVCFAAPSMLPWWKLDLREGRQRTLVESAPFATFMACQLAPMLALRDVWSDAGLSTPWIGASYPDAVNHILAASGEAPTCGVGNLAEAVPKIRFALAQELELPPSAFEVRLVAQHAFEYFCYRSEPVEDAPPYLLEALYEDRDFSVIAGEGLFEPFPLPYNLDFNRITVSASLEVIEGLLQETPVRTHVPGPSGRLGGYPVRLSRAGIELDLAPQWDEIQAEQINRDSLPFDGIEDIDDQGTVWFTPPCIEAIEAITGTRVDFMSEDSAPDLARLLVDKLS